MEWELCELCEDIYLTVEKDSVWLRSPTYDLNSSEYLTSLKSKTRLGRLLPTLIPQLLELGFATSENKSIKIPFLHFVELEDNDIDAFDGIVPWAPFAIEINAQGSLCTPGFKLNLRFYLGMQQVHLERVGCFVKRAGKIYRLDKQSFYLVDTVDSFNSLSVDEKVKPDTALPIFAEIKGLAEGVGADIDRYILSERIIIPSKIGLDLIVENDNRITFVPKVDGAPDDAMIKAFLSSEDIEGVYSLDTKDGGRIRVMMDESQKEVLRRIRKVRKLGGVDKANILSNPYKIFDGVAGNVEIDLAIFGPRVRGIGDFPFVSQPFIQYGTTGIFDDPDFESTPKERSKLNVGITCSYADGAKEDVFFKNREDLLAFRHEVKTSWEKGLRTVNLNGKTIILDEEFIGGIDAIVEKVTKPERDRAKEKPSGRYLLIYTNETEIEYKEDEKSSDAEEKEFYLPNSLRSDVDLKDHQTRGVRWLQHNYRLVNRRGCFLADDMGLGKTLQVLVFLAWLIERGNISPEGNDNEIAPWNPILIVSPVMLLENETWINDMKMFFDGDGAVFKPWLILHGAELKKFRYENLPGRETEIERSVLDLDRLRQYRVILTNYETVVNYQYSFAQMKSSWSVVVTDEAQEYKTTNTKISHALKSLSPGFRIALTGTPVETRLSDVWNIFDFLQPGNLLGSALEFSREFEKPIAENEENRKRVLEQLRKRLLYGKKNAYLMRREKSSTLQGLPIKHEQKVYCDLSQEQREKHFDYVNSARIREEGAHPFAVIHHLMKLYQHPALIPRYEGFNTNDIQKALDSCPKLESVVNLLYDIRKRDEKALIFTRSLDMQQLLATIISAHFNISVDIINGITSRGGSTRYGRNTRRNIVKRFRESAGFNVIVLSPDVAGIGLTIVEANHVIHYGRWWNPAKEVQATDRVYRIGQERDVYVYYLIARDPEKKFKTFDEKLDSLLERRKELATDFLAPMPTEKEMGNELMEEILASDDIDSVDSTPIYLTTKDISILPWDRFEALIALLEKKQGNKTILTPRTGDYGIDVISIHRKEIRLIQCKHTIWGTHVDNDVIAETISAFDNYRGRILCDISKELILKPILVTNGKYSRNTLLQANIHGLQLLDNEDICTLMDSYPCTFAEIEMVESARMTSFQKVCEAINSAI